MHKNDVTEFIAKIDAHVTRNHGQLLNGRTFELKIIGKCALLLAGMNDTIGTVDLDTLGVEGTAINQTIKESLIKEFGRPRQPIHGYYLEFVAPAFTFLPQSPNWLALTEDSQSLAVYYLDSHDIIASKLFSAFSPLPRSKDLQDVTAALDQKLVGLTKVLARADQIFDVYSMDSRSDRFPAVYGYVTEKLIPNYGGGTLMYRPEES